MAVSHTEGYADKAVSADAENRRPDAPVVYLIGAARLYFRTVRNGYCRCRQQIRMRSAGNSAHRATESNACPMAVPVSHNRIFRIGQNIKQASSRPYTKGRSLQPSGKAGAGERAADSRKTACPASRKRLQPGTLYRGTAA